jgi:hypothetical protein
MRVAFALNISVVQLLGRVIEGLSFGARHALPLWSDIIAR